MTTSPEHLYFNDFARSVISTLPIRQKTRSTYISAFTRHIEPALRFKTLHEVSRADVHRVIAPLSPQLAATTLAVLKTLYREGIAGEDGAKYFAQPELKGYQVFVVNRHENTTWSI